MSDFIYEPISSVTDLANYADSAGVIRVRFLADLDSIMTNSYEENLNYFVAKVINIPGYDIDGLAYQLVGANTDGSAIIEIVGAPVEY